MSGILPAIVTPVDAEERFSSSAFEKLIASFYEAGVDGLYVCGNTGEGLLLDAAAREAAAEAAVANSSAGKQVIVHVGAHRQSEAIRLTRHASRLGVAAVSSLPPGSSYGFAETKAYYQALAGASSVPVLVYHFPSIASFSLAQLEELCAIPGVAGLKFTSFDLYSLRQLRAGGERVIFNGHDEVLAAGLLMGASGGIGSTYNLMPGLFVDLWTRARGGDWDGAIAVQDRINALIRILLDYPLIAAIKQVLTWRGIPCGSPVAPRGGLTEAQLLSLRSRVEAWERG
jgi:N-acetylneuraminate lyase